LWVSGLGKRQQSWIIKPAALFASPDAGFSPPPTNIKPETGMGARLN